MGHTYLQVRGNPPNKKITQRELGWLAGFLDGEGSFLETKGVPWISVPSTDKDLIEHAQALCGGSIYYQAANKYQANRKEQWKLKVCGVRAVGIMFTVYSLLSIRRQRKIKEIITKWHLRPTADVFRKGCRKGHPETSQYLRLQGSAKTRRVCKDCSRDQNRRYKLSTRNH